MKCPGCHLENTAGLYDVATGAHERISEWAKNPGALTNDSIYKGGGPDPLGAAGERNLSTIDFASRLITFLSII